MVYQTIRRKDQQMKWSLVQERGELNRKLRSVKRKVWIILFGKSIDLWFVYKWTEGRRLSKDNKFVVVNKLNGGVLKIGDNQGKVHGNIRSEEGGNNEVTGNGADDK